MSKGKFHPKVSIIIPVYNGSNYLREAIDSALAQTYDNFEVIVVNDGSNDNGKTEKICKSYGDKIRYIKKENGGVASALNKGIKEMKGEYFSWLSHDDIYYPDKLEKQINFLKTQKNKKVVLYSNVEFIDSEGKVRGRTCQEKIHNLKALNTKLYPPLKGLMNGCSLLIPKDILIEFNGFNENLKTSSDYDLWFKITRKYNVRFLPDILVKYRQHEEQGTRTESCYLDESNRLWANTIKNLSRKEINRFEKSLFKFYHNSYVLLNNSGYNYAKKVALDLAKQHYDPEKIKLTIICYNIENNPSAKESIESLLSQTYANFDFIILIKNDFDSQKIAKTFKRKDFRVSIAENNHEVTFLDALILAKSIKKGKYITFSDCNGKLTKESLDKQINFLENNNKYKMSCINVKKRDSYYTRDLYIADTVPLEWQAVWGVPIAGKNTVYRKEIFNNTTIPNKHTNNDLIYYDFLTNILTKHKSYLLEDEWYKYYARSDIQEKDINIFRMINENYLKNFFNIREIKNITQFISFSKTKDTKNFNCLNFLNWMYSLKDKMDQKYLFSKAELEQITTNIQDRLIDIISIPLIKEINKKNIIIKNQEQQIKKYQNSRSWKITKPLRKITSLWKKLSRIFN